MAQCPKESNGKRCGLGPDHTVPCQFSSEYQPHPAVKAYMEDEHTELYGLTIYDCADAMARRIDLIHKERDELQHTFDLRWKASMRAIKLWQKRTGRKLVWPDHCDMVVWLLEQLDEAKKPSKKKT